MRAWLRGRGERGEDALDARGRDVWPLIRKACPEARLIIAGNKPERIPSFASHPPGVEFTGFVEDLGQLYQRVGIVCCSILSGGGTRLKILEAAAYGKAIVSTTWVPKDWSCAMASRS